MADEIDVSKVTPYAVAGPSPGAMSVAKIVAYAIVNGNAPPTPPGPRRRQVGVSLHYGPPGS